ncbi:hypothetical protein GCM10020001_035880 [Nonomuraea salmonea]
MGNFASIAWGVGVADVVGRRVLLEIGADLVLQLHRVAAHPCRVLHDPGQVMRVGERILVAVGKILGELAACW